MLSLDPTMDELTKLLSKTAAGFDLTRREFRAVKVYYAEFRSDFRNALDDCEEDESRTLAICFALADFESHKTPFEDYFQQVNHAYLRVRDLPGRGRELRAEIALHTARAAGFYPSFKSSQTRLDNSLVIHEFLGSLIYIRKGLLQYAGYKRRQSRRSTSLTSNNAISLDLAA